MKLFHYGLALTAATVLLSGCSNNEPEQPQPAVFIPGNSEVEIRFGANDADLSTSVDKRHTVTGDADLEMGVFCLARSIQNQSEGVPAIDWFGDNSYSACLMKNIRTQKTGNTLTWEGKYFYPISQFYTYEFYGYYPYVEDGESITYTPGTGSRAVVHYTIDGTQDIIWGRATAEGTLYGYSARFFRYEEHKDDIPNIALKHLLTRLQFQVETGASTENGGEPFPDADKVSVKSIAIRDAISGVDLVVADLARRSPSTGMQMSERLEIREPQETAEFTLRESDDSDEPMTPVPLPTELGTPKRVGGSIMLVPAGEYLLKVILHKDGDGPEDPGTDLETEKSLKVESIVESGGQKIFNPGVSYMVTIKVNDFKEVDAQATLSDWQYSANNPPTVEL